MLYQLTLTQSRTYLYSALFIVANLFFPQLVHLIPNGGAILLPFYFFTLIAGYKYGFSVGLITAVVSPLLCNLVLGMPAVAWLPIVLIKSILAALAAAFVAKWYNKVSILTVALAVVLYTAVGFLIEWAMSQNIHIALNDILIGYPGILLQIVGGYFLLKK